MVPGEKVTAGSHALPDMSGWSKRERIAYLSRQGADPKVIAAMLGMKPSVVRVVRAQLRAEGYDIPGPDDPVGRRVEFRLPPALEERAKAEARRRRMSVPDLMTAICAAVLQGDLVSAVLDDGAA